MKKTVLVICFFASFCIHANAQQNNAFKPSITIGFSKNFADYGDLFDIDERVELSSNTCGAMFINADLFEINRCFSGGLYIGGQTASLIHDGNVGTSYFAGRVGITAHLHLLPQSDMWDVSLNASLGCFWSPHIVPQTEYGLGLSTTFYPLKHLGLLIGCDWGDSKVSKYNCQFVQKGSMSLKTGVRIRF